MAAWSDREAELWGSLGTQGTLAAPRRISLFLLRILVQECLELDSDLTLGNGVKKLEVTTTIGLGVGMSDLGEPGFSEEVALSRRA